MYYSLILIFFCIPLYFSHVLAPFGLGGLSIDSILFPFQIFISDHSSFERQKVYLFLGLIFLASIEGILFHSKALFGSLRKYGLIFLVLAIIPFFSHWISFGAPSTEFWWGGYEKHHGYIFFVGILLYVQLLLSHSTSHLKKYLFYSFLSAIFVAGIAIGEYIGGIWDIYGRSEMLSNYTGRSSSTLGNPNYLAGFLIIYIPIIYFYYRKYHSISWLLFLVALGFIGAIFATGSYIAIYILLGMFVWYQLRFLLSERSLGVQIVLCIFILGVVAYIGRHIIDEEKLLSLDSRFILMKDVIIHLLHNSYVTVIGYGPDSILSYFNNSRSLIVNSYFPQNMLIDSSHNMLIDIWFQYGILPIYLLGIGLWRIRSQLLSSIGIAYIMGICFLLLNVFVLVHVLILLLIFVILWQENQNILSTAIKKSK